MSIQVEPDELADALRVYRSAYLVTVGADAHAHVVAVTPKLDGSALTLTGLGRRSLDNLVSNAAVTLVWPPRESGGHSLIVDGVAQSPASDSAASEPGTDADPTGQAAIRVVVSRAVLHRPAPDHDATGPDGCAADCIDLPPDRSSPTQSVSGSTGQQPAESAESVRSN